MDISSHGATLTWQGPAYDGGSTVEGYRVEMCKVSLLSISQDGFWRTLTELCKVDYYLRLLSESTASICGIQSINHVVPEIYTATLAKVYVYLENTLLWSVNFLTDLLLRTGKSDAQNYT